MEQKEKDLIPALTPGQLPLFEEPVVDALSDRNQKDLKKKPVDRLTANDRAVLDLMKSLPLIDLLQKGFMEVSMDIGNGIKATFRTLVYSQLERISNDVSRFQQQREVQKQSDGKERLTWQPSVDEIRTYNVKRTLAESLISVLDKSTGQVSGERLAYIESLDGMIVNALYRKMQQLFTAVSLLFPSDNQKELVESLKKV